MVTYRDVSERLLLQGARRIGLDDNEITGSGVQTSDGAVHHLFCAQVKGPKRRAAADEGVGRVELTLLEIVEHNASTTCCRISPTMTSDAFAVVRHVVCAERLARSVHRRVKANKAHGGDGRAEALAREVADYLAGPQPRARNATEVAALETALDELATAAAELGAARGGPAARDALTRQLWAELQPGPAGAKHNAPPVSVADAAPWLVAVFPAHRPPNKLVAEVLATFAHTPARRRPTAVLVAPRLVVDWLHRQSGPRTNWASAVAISAVPLPVDEDLVELAAELVDLEVSGSSEVPGVFATLPAALEVASALRSSGDRARPG